MDMLNTISLSTPAELLAATPHMLGFYPTESLVLSTLHRRESTTQLGMTLRVDLPNSTYAQEFAGYLLTGPFEQHPVDAVIMLLITDNASPGLPHTELVTTLRDTLNQASISTLDALWAPAIREGAPWRSYLDPTRSGTLPNPAISPLAAAQAVRGSTTRPSRQDLHALIAAEDSEQALSAKLAALRSQPIPAPSETLPHRIHTVREALQATAAGKSLSEEQLLRVLIAVADTRVRDLALSAALGDWSQAADELWRTLIRKAPTPERGEVASLLAVHAYLCGDGPLARVVLENLEQSQPDHRLGALLHQALDQGIPPAELITLVNGAAHGILEELGWGTNPFTASTQA
ncbi:DUF4192 domain-containing protein [Actinopolyspora erythraea]|uniref:DUF4192 domain-containing protein n=1 Tax=Actinopolyspora erythraea TaxID=414996 RepID=A0A223RTI9_9ACTN|nr:DUF4192 domain-containing protein [Actinopolyspora erythraea]ASU79195.1 DUF4192 domain-containing protein [Actinopolyspora erythraea]